MRWLVALGGFLVSLALTPLLMVGFCAACIIGSAKVSIDWAKR